MAYLGDLLVTGAARFINVIKGTSQKAQNGCYYGTCDTSAAVAAKVINVNDTNFALQPGTIIAVKFTYTNTASSVTLNVNSTGAKSIWYNTSVYTASDSAATGGAGRVHYYVYDGTYWVFLNNSQNWWYANTDTKVTQTTTTTSANYEVLFSETADNTTRTEGARKNNNLLFNPSTGNLQVTQINGVTVGSSPKFTDNNTTYAVATTAANGLMSSADKTKVNNLGSLASKNAATVAYTPAGTVSKPTFSGTAATLSSKGTPAGTVSIPTITVTPSTTTVNSITAVGTLPSWGTSVTGEKLTITWSAGTLPTKGSNTTVATGITTATSSRPTFSGAQLTSTVAYTPAGSVSQPTFSGTAATLSVS